MFLSVIIPVYGVEKYIRDCLMSCLQLERYCNSIEFIIVNDGTKDKSINIAQEVVKGHHNVQILEKENGGLSSARNTGLRIAKGDYIWFVDSDDKIEPSIISDIQKSIADNSTPEILAFYTKIVYEDDSHLPVECPRKIPSDSIITGPELYFADYRYPYSGVQYYCFKRSFLLDNNLFFKEGIIFEDILYIAQTLSLAQRCVYINKSGYLYLLREGSITQQKSDTRRCSQLLSIMDSMKDSMDKPLSRHGIKVMQDAIARCFGVFYRYNFRYLNQSEKQFIRDDFFRRKYILSSILKSGKVKYLCHYILLFF